jgi:hypothetical protein
LLELDSGFDRLTGRDRELDSELGFACVSGREVVVLSESCDDDVDVVATFSIRIFGAFGLIVDMPFLPQKKISIRTS